MGTPTLSTVPPGGGPPPPDNELAITVPDVITYSGSVQVVWEVGPRVR